MNLVQLHPYGACSSLILYNLGDADLDPAWFLATFCKLFSSPVTVTSTLEAGAYPTDMSFIVASTLNQDTAEDCLKFLGFTECGQAYNNKNGTSPTFWFATVPTVVENLMEKFHELPPQAQEYLKVGVETKRLFGGKK